MEKLYLLVRGDTNDGDDIEKFKEISEEHFREIIPVIEAIEDFKPYDGTKFNSYTNWFGQHHHNYPNTDYRRHDEGEKSPEELYGHIPGFTLFQDYVPYGEHGVHSIIDIKLFKVADVQKLL